MKTIILVLIAFLSIGYSNAQTPAVFKSTDGYFGLKDNKGNVILDAKYGKIGSFSNGVAPIMEMVYEDYFFDYIEYETWGLVDINGDIVLEPTYDMIRTFTNGYAAFKSGSKWGFLDPTGKAVISAIYDDVQDFSNGKAKVVSSDGRSFYIDKYGKEVK